MRGRGTPFRSSLFIKPFGSLPIIKGNAQFVQKVTFEPLMHFKQNWKCYKSYYIFKIFLH